MKRIYLWFCLAVLVTTASHATPVSIRLTYYSDFDLTNAPTGLPYGGRTQIQHVFADSNAGVLDFDFTNPFNTPRFAVVVGFKEYVSTSGYYITYLSSLNPYWTNFQNFGYIDPFQIGSWANEVPLNAGINDLQVAVLGVTASDDLGSFHAGPPYHLEIDVPTPWGGDPRVEYAEHRLLSIPDTGTTAELMVLALAATWAFGRLRLRRARGHALTIVRGARG